MTMSRKFQVAVVAVGALALGLGLHQVLPTSKLTPAPTLESLPGRHLQPPWWEVVRFHSTSKTSTYVVPSDVLFATDSSMIDSYGASVLDGLVPKLRGARSVTVAGCTDSVGGVDSTFNVALGKNRADAAIAILEAAGLPASLFHPVSWADTHPVANVAGLDTATINALNRRIVLIVTK
jgi:outer membrane protein OmpA-like peptidoglycan-associated protein